MQRVPRDYQSEAVDAVLFAWCEFQRILLRLGTGGGKTVIAAILIRMLLPKRCLYIGDQDELIWQPVKAIDEWADVLAAVEKATKKASLRAKVVVASSQSISKPDRLERFPPDFFDYIIIDEAHRGAERDKRVCDYFSRAKVLGITATPFNASMRDLSKYYECVAFDLPMLDLIGLGYAPPLKVLTLPVEIDLAGVKTDTTGEYEEESLSTTIAPYYEEICRLLKVHAAGRKIIAFLPLIESSKSFAAIARNAGLRAIHVDASAPDRAEILERFRRGQYDVLCNVQVVETGVDVPIADCFVNLRPIRSMAKYQQGLGRCMRPLPGVIDGVENSEDRKLAISLSDKPDTLVIDFLWEHEKLGVMHPGHLFAKTEEEAELIHAQTKKVRTPEQLQAIAERVLKEREAELVKRLEKASLRDPSKAIDPLLFASLAGYTKLLEYEPIQRWEMDPPSPKQLSTLSNWGVDPNGITSKGMAAKVMDACMFRFRFRMATPQQLGELHRLGIKHDGKISRSEADRKIAATKLQKIQ